MRRLVTGLVAVAVMSLTAATPAAAHGDQRLVVDEVPLDAGETVAFPGELHYHRLVGRFVASGSISIRLVDERTSAVVIEAGPGSDLAVNELVRCCDGSAWAAHRLEVENLAHRPIVVDAAATLVHDDLAVSVFRAEPGVIEGMLALAAVWVYGLIRTRRRAGTTAKKAAGTLAVVSVAVLSVALGGWVRYGSGSVPGLLAGAVDVPLFPINPIASRASVIVFLAMIGWAVAAARWAGARHRMSPAAWSALAAVLVGGVVVAAALVTTEYGTSAMPAFLATLAAVPIGITLIVENRTHTAAVPEPPPITVEPVR